MSMTTPYSGSTSGAVPTGQSTQEIRVQGNSGGGHLPPSSPAHSGDLGTPMTDNGRPDVEGVSVGQLIGEVTKDLSTLMRQELELAKVEVKAEAKKAGQGAGLFGAAGFAG